MKRIVLQIVASLLLLFLCISPSFNAQAGTNVFPSQASVTTMLSSVTTTSVSPVWINPSYTGHQLFYNISAGTTFLLKLQGSPDNSNWYDLTSSSGTNGANSFVTASGFYPYIRVNLAQMSGASPSCTAIYAGSPSGIATNATGQVTVQGFTGMTPIDTYPQVDNQITNGNPICTFSYTANNSCDVGLGTATGTGCSITNSSSCTFNNSSYYRVTCNTSIQYQINSSALNISYGASLPANTPEKSFWKMFLAVGQGPHIEVLSSASGSCDIEQLVAGP